MSSAGSMESETLVTDQQSDKVVKDKEVGISKGTEEHIACTVVAKVGEKEEKKSGTSEHVESECSEIAAAETNGKASENSKDEATPIEKEKQDKEECQAVDVPKGTDTVESTETSACLAEKDHEKIIEQEEDAKKSDLEVLVEAKGVEEGIEKDASDVTAHDDEKCEELQVDNGKKEEEKEESKEFVGSELLDSNAKVEEQQKEECKVEAPLGTDAAESTTDHEKRIEEGCKHSNSEVLIEAKGVEKDGSDGKSHDEKCEELQVDNGKKEESKDFSGSEVLDSTTKVEEVIVVPSSNSDEKEKCDPEISEIVAKESDKKEEMTSVEVKSREEQSDDSCSQPVLVSTVGEEKDEDCKDSTSVISGAEDGTKGDGTAISTKEEHEAEVLEEKTEKHTVDVLEESKEEVDIPQEKSVLAESKEPDDTIAKEPEVSEKSEQLLGQEIGTSECSEKTNLVPDGSSDGIKESDEVETGKIPEEQESESSGVVICETSDSSETKKVLIEEDVSKVEERSLPFASDATENIKTLVSDEEPETQATVTATTKTIISFEEIKNKCEEEDPKEVVEQDSDKTNSICGEESKKEGTEKITFAEELLKEEIAEGKISPTASITELVNELVATENKDDEDQTEVLAKEVPASVVQVPPSTESETVEEEKRVEASNPEHVKEREEEEEELKEKEMTKEREHEHVTAKTDEGDHEEHHSSSKHGHHGIMSKVKHSISKVKKKILGKSSSSKAMSSDNKEEN